ncbi:2-nitropropane dioxygenase, NPD [Caballeronia terrestris]|uniref:Nitronate monooxygenase n=1 Tax=Caballeronia terrestris TaxID=1226301 RepID=A0A158FUX4_9BURK|nr:nitronate monooxygenase [Caballeronia terrestris]SAL23149.1 2-nitropropane dioxygenase, NPD [Caballeronia terrestris]
MPTWRNPRIIELFGIDTPIIQAPMAGSSTPDLAIAVSEAGGLGSLPCALMSVDQAREAIGLIRSKTSRALNLNFFCHATPPHDPVRNMRWRNRLAPLYVEFGIDPEVTPPSAGRRPFDDEFCALVEATRPEVVSFHFGLPEARLLDRVKAAGAKVISSATTVAEARWLEERGCDAIIAMGLEAGGHRGNFLTDDMATQVGTFALVPQVVDAVKVPVIAAGGIADARGIVAAFALGASAVQIGTAYLFCPEVRLAAHYTKALREAVDDATALTNIFTGRPARGIVNRAMRELGPLSEDAPAFPLAGGALLPLKTKAEQAGSGEFTNHWSGQAARLAREMPAGEFTRVLAAEALALAGVAAD